MRRKIFTIPDYKLWLDRPIWTLEEAVALLVNLDPKCIRKWLNSRIFDDPKLEEYTDKLKTAELCRIYDEKDDAPGMLLEKRFAGVKPTVFVQWAKTKGYTIPDELEHLLKTESPKQETATQEVTPPAAASSNPRQSQLDKVACQAIARTLWKATPDMTIADMAKTEDIQKFGHAACYTDKTVRGWLSGVDIRPPEMKTGRPKK
jgi:hypothetical protein